MKVPASALSAPPRPNRQRARTRAAILGAGEQLFSTRPIEGVSIDEIVETADVAKGSFYNHFDDKEDLARTIVELVQGDCGFHIFTANRDIDDPAKRMVRAHCVMIAYAFSHPDRLQAMLSFSARTTSINSRLNAGVVADLENGLSLGRFHGLDVSAALIVVIGIGRLAIAHALSSDEITAPASFAAEIGRALLRALGLADEEAAIIAQESAQDLLSTVTK